MPSYLIFKDFRDPWTNVQHYLDGNIDLEPLEWEGLLYRAPELLREPDSKYIENANSAMSQALLQKCDVYR